MLLDRTPLTFTVQGPLERAVAEGERFCAAMGARLLAVLGKTPGYVESTCGSDCPTCGGEGYHLILESEIKAVELVLQVIEPGNQKEKQ